MVDFNRLTDSMKYLGGTDWRDNFNKMLDKKYAIKQQDSDTLKNEQLAKAPMYAAQVGYLGDVNQMHRDVAGMQYGPDGQGDRNNAALAGLRSATAGHYDTLSKEGAFKLGVAQETRPSLISNINATRGLNTATNIGEMNEAGWKNYEASKSRTAAMPYWNEPYQKAAIPERRGLFSKLWAGDVYNPFSEQNAAEEAEQNKITALNTSYYKKNPLARPR
jgi:hypothetical protein